MIAVEKWWLCAMPVDMRKRVDSLTLQVMQHFEEGLQKRTAYLFCNKNGTRLKALLWDGLGFWCCLRRLEKGRFVWPRSGGLHELNADQFAWLTCGLDWQKWHESLPQPVWL
jgi:transposase